jgi:hypothetical protein
MSPDDKPPVEFVTREALRLMSTWNEADNPEQYADDVRIDLAVQIVIRTYAVAKERST